MELCQMNVILPVAGLGTRLRPQTWSRPKPLVSLAGRTVLDHVLDRLSPLNIERVVFVTGYLGDQIEEYVRANYDFDSVFVEQKHPRGQSDAIIRARGKLSGPTMVIFPDMVFEADMTDLESSNVDGAIFVKEVPDPSRFGVVVKEGERIAKLVEKPDEPISNLAVMGAYYFADVDRLIEAIDRQIEQNLQTKGEFFIADAIQLMIDDGAHFTAPVATVWEDCGTRNALLDTNRYLLEKIDETPQIEGSVIVPPVYVDPSATVANSIIGPYASIGAGATVYDSIVRDSIVDEGAEVRTSILERSIIGRNAFFSDDASSVNIGDSSEVLMRSSARRNS
jgi:glucose-1-phosphate thymidylyltransferase